MILIGEENGRVKRRKGISAKVKQSEPLESFSKRGSTKVAWVKIVTLSLSLSRFPDNSARIFNANTLENVAPYVQQSTSSWLALFFHRPPASILLLARRATRWSAGFSRAGRRIWVEISASVNETSSHEGCFSSHQVLSARTATGDSVERLGKQGSGASSFRFFISMRRFHFALRVEFAFRSSWNIGVLVVTASVDNGVMSWGYSWETSDWNLKRNDEKTDNR